MRYSKSLDGIRAIAVIFVMLFHFGYFAPGWVGVQIFFTLSGFLITGILLRDDQSAFPRYIGTFFWHRALRIFPVLFTYVLIAGISFALCDAPESFRADWPWLVTFTANFARMRSVDLGPPFVHIWSLAVEQQFYLLWPLLAFFLPSNVFRLVVAGLLVLTPVLRFVIFSEVLRFRSDPTFAGMAVYVLPFVQFDSFAAGAAISLWGLDTVRNPGRWFAVGVAILGMAGFAVLLSQYLGGHGAFIGGLGYELYLLPGYGFVWGYTLLNLCSMLAIMCALQRVGPMFLLESRPLVWVGKISFGMYVYHLPLMLIGLFLMTRWGLESNPENRALLFVVWVIGVLFTSAASFRWLETPFLRLKNYWWENTH